MTNVYSEISYDRSKGAKVLQRVPQHRSGLSFDGGTALRNNYDFICAVDTNTRSIGGKRVSVVGVATAMPITVPERQGLGSYWKYDVPFCREYVGLKTDRPENFGWMVAWEILTRDGAITPATRVAMIVDSDLGNLAAYNARKLPVDLGQMLPPNVQLIYASADSGRDSVVNYALVLADTASSGVLDRIEKGELPQQGELSNSPYFEYERHITIHAVDGQLPASL
jgi:hypothetical protein